MKIGQFTKLLLASSTMSAALVGCGGNSEEKFDPIKPHPDTKKIHLAAKDNIPDTEPDILIPDLEDFCKKILQGKVEKVYLYNLGGGNPYYRAELKNGNTVFFEVPDTKEAREQIIKACQDDPKGRQFIKAIERADKPMSLDWLLVLALFASLGGVVYLGKSAVKAMNSSQPGMGNPFRRRIINSDDPSLKYGLDDVKGNPKNRDLIRNLVGYMQDLKEGKETNVPRGVLVYGSPGTGKTFMAKIIAKESGVNFLSATGAEFVDIYVGNGANKIRKLFDAAREKQPIIVFIDEIDTIACPRGTGHDGGNSERDQTVDQFLAELDGFKEDDGILVIGATNKKPSELDEALMRPGRFDYKEPVYNPSTKEHRREILDLYLDKQRKLNRLTDDIDIDDLAQRTSMFSPAMLKAIVDQADQIRRINNTDQICSKDLHKAISQVAMGSESNIVLNEENKRLVAYHEFAGHYFVARATNTKVNRVSIIPQGETLGSVSLEPSDSELINASKGDLLKRLLILLAGRGAEKKYLNKEIIGAQSDYDSAKNIIRQMLGSNMLNDTMRSYDQGEELSGEDEKLATQLLKEATLTAAKIVAVPTEQAIKPLIDEIFEVEELDGKEANELGDRVIDEKIWQEAEKIADTFVSKWLSVNHSEER